MDPASRHSPEGRRQEMNVVELLVAVLVVILVCKILGVF